MTRLPERLAQLEQTRGSQAENDARRVADRKADADMLMASIARLAGRFDAADIATPIKQRLAKMSPAQHCAWEIRFADQQTPVFKLMAMHDAFRATGQLRGSTMESTHAHR